MKVALCGPSGVGKTTLANYIASTHELKFLPNSAGLLLAEEVKDDFKEKYGYDNKGHQNVINLGNRFPKFGKAFQHEIALARNFVLKDNDDIIIDRSPVDNLVYFMAQCAHNCTEDEIQEHIELCQEGWKEVTHCIQINVTNPEGIEDNGSRVSNKFFQEKMDILFNYYIRKYFNEEATGHKCHVIRLDFWDLDKRKRAIDNLLLKYS